MTNDPPRLRSGDGFTLIEVLVAMVILAVGLLGLEALGIGASRMIVRAEKQSRVSTLAATHLENGRQQARLNPTPRSSCASQNAAGDVVCVAIASVAGAPSTRRVTVTVRPAQTTVPIDTFVVSSTVYDPASINP